LYHTHSRVQHTWSDQFKGGWTRFDELWGEQEWVDHEDQLKWDLLWIGHETDRETSNRERDNRSGKDTFNNEPSPFFHVVRKSVKHLERIPSNVFGMVWTLELPFECEQITILNSDFKQGVGIREPKEPLWLKMDCRNERNKIFYLRMRPFGSRKGSWLGGTPAYAGEFHVSGVSAPREVQWKTHEFFQRSLYGEHTRIMQEMQRKNRKTPSKSIGTIDDRYSPKVANTMLLQYLVDANRYSKAELEMVFFDEEAVTRSSIGKQVLSSKNLHKLNQYIESEWNLDTIQDKREQLRQRFDARFSEIFPVEEKMGSAYMNMARYALSNMLGTVGFFHGNAKHATGPINPETGKPLSESKGPYSLLSGVPCRTKFPRGFLWDEGFHQLLIRKWDSDLSKTILSYWFSLADKNGWIPREQILGDEARSFVPAEFVDQHPHHANPPTLFFALEKFIDEALEVKNVIDVSLEAHQVTNAIIPNITQEHEHYPFIESTYPDIKRHYQWFLRTQEGVVPGSFRWRGRETNHTLSSGLDDYPRGTFEPQKTERHLDLYCWIFMMTRTMHKYALFLNKQDDASVFQKRMESMKVNFDHFHYSEELKWYADFVGPRKSGDNADKHDPMINEEGYSTHIGYVSLFPVISHLVDPQHALYKRSLKIIKSSKVGLWSKHGLRSLSKNDPLYGEAENYWRGPVWMNINYLVLRALHENFNVNLEEDEKVEASKESELSSITQKVYESLRKNVIRTVQNGFLRKKTLFEQYDGENGHPKGTSPFTGWTSLIVQIMSESY